MSSRRPQAPNAMVPQQSQRRPRRPQVPQSSQSLVPHQQQQRSSRRPNNELVPAQQRQAPNALVPHKPRSKRQPDALVPYEEPMSYRDEYEPPPARPFMAQFCEPRCFILLLLILFFGLLLLIAIILLITSLDKGDPDGLAGWTYPIPSRDPGGYSNSQEGDRFGTAVSSSGEFMAISSPNRENPNGSTGAIFLYVWLGNTWAVYGSDGILTPPDVDYEQKTWVDFQQNSNKESNEEKEANRIHFDNDGANAVKWSDDGRRVMIGIPAKNSVVVYEFKHPLKDSDYIASITVEGPYEDAGRAIAVSRDANRIAVTAKYNQTKEDELQTIDADVRRFRYLQDVGANSTNSTNATGLPGVVQVFDYDLVNQTWVMVGEPIAPQEQSALAPQGWGDNMVMSLDGTTLAIANPTYDNNLGLVDIFRISEETGVWEFLRSFKGDFPGGQFGYALSMSADGNTMAFGAPFYDNGEVNVWVLSTGSFTNAGQTVTTSSWQQKGVVFKGNSTGGWFGYSLDISENGDSIVIGSPKAYGGVGKMIIYDYVFGRWYPYVDLPQRDQYGNYQASGNYGASVSMTNNGDSITIGAPNHSSAADGYDYVEFFDKAPKGMDLTGRIRPEHVLAEHPDDDEFGR